eukprot:superscaffoldBa00010174_g24558
MPHLLVLLSTFFIFLAIPILLCQPLPLYAFLYFLIPPPSLLVFHHFCSSYPAIWQLLTTLPPSTCRNSSLNSTQQSSFFNFHHSIIGSAFTLFLFLVSKVILQTTILYCPSHVLPCPILHHFHPFYKINHYLSFHIPLLDIISAHHLLITSGSLINMPIEVRSNHHSLLLGHSAHIQSSDSHLYTPTLPPLPLPPAMPSPSSSPSPNSSIVSIVTLLVNIPVAAIGNLGLDRS